MSVMAILIDMEMPKNCDNCDLCSVKWTSDDDASSWAYCHPASRQIASAYSGDDRIVARELLDKPEWCPLKDVVTCGECKHWYSDADTGMACEFTSMSQPEDGFCNWGERKAR